MKSTFEFIKTTIIGGIVVIVPVTLLALVVIETVELAGIVVDPIIEYLPVDEIGGLEIAVIVSVLIVLGACFAAGLLARSRRAAALGGWLEDNVLGKIPIYRLIRTAARSFSPVGNRGRQMKPAILALPDQTQALVIVIEELANGHATVFLPSAPVATAGAIRYVSQAQLKPVDASLMEVADVVMQWGFGAGKLFDPALKAD